MAEGQAGILLQHVRKIAAARQTEGLSDRELLGRFAHDRDEAAFAVLVRRRGPMVLRVCQRVLHNWHDAEDAFQATFLTLARQAPARLWHESVASWLYVVAYRLALKIKAGTGRRARPAPVPAKAPEDPLSVATGRELCAVLDEELSRLSEKYRAPLVLCCLEGFTQDEAARQFGWSLGTLRRRLEQGRALLRQRLTRRGLSLSAALAGVLWTERAARATVPLGLVQAAVRTAGQGALRQGVPAALVSSRAAVLAEGVLKGMGFTRLKTALAVVLAVSIAGAGAGLAWQQVPASTQPAEAKQPEPPRPAIQGPGQARAALDHYGDPLPEGALARLGTVRLRHGSSVYAVAFAPDGQTVASVSQDNTLRLWDVADGKERRRIEDDLGDLAGFLGTDSLWRVAFTPDGKTLATASLNRPIRLWDVATGQLLRRFDMQHQVLWLAISPDGRTLAYDGPDQTIRLAELATGKERLRLAVPKREGLGCGAFAPDGKTLAAAVGGTELRCWDLGTGTELSPLAGSPKGVRSIVFSPDNRTLISGGGDQTIRFWEVATGREVRALTVPEKGDSAPLLALSRDGKLLVSGHQRRVRFWDVAAGKELGHFQARGSHLYGLALSPDGKTLATGSQSDNTVRLWEVPTGKPLLRDQGPEQGLRTVAFSPDGRLLATGGHADDVRVWEAATGKELHRFPTQGRVAFTPDGRILIGGGWTDGKFHLWDPVTGQERRRFQAHQGWVVRVAVAPDGKTFASLGGADLMVRLWNLATGRQVHDFGGKQKSFVTWVAFTPDGKTLATLHQDERALRLWDVATGKERHHLLGHAQAIASLAFAPDGLTLASGGYDGVLFLWETATGGERWHGKIGSSLDELAFAPDGHTLAWGSQHEKTIHLWEVRARQERGQLRGHHGPITGLDFAADNTRLASTSTDGTALVWDLTGTQSNGGRPPQRLTPEELKQLWEQLDGGAAGAYRAMVRLRTAPGQAVALLRKHLTPVPRADAQRLARLLGDLDSDQFAVREKATRELDRLGGAAEPALRQTLRDRPTLEVRRRVEKLLEKHEAPQVRASRAVEVLEQLGTAAARGLLDELAHGAPGAWLSEEASAARKRLAERAAAKP